jgi:macrophage erythroblast attacher
VKQHVVPFADLHLRAIQQLMGLVAFPADTNCMPYRLLYDKSFRWRALIKQFRSDNYTLHSLAPLSALEVTLQAGLSALKTASCARRDDKNVNCPVCVEQTFSLLAEKLPLGHHVNSCYVCRITGEIMDEDNPPMVTPDGYVYSRKSVKETALKNNDLFRCPRTQKVYPSSKLKKMFLT